MPAEAHEAALQQTDAGHLSTAVEDARPIALAVSDDRAETPLDHASAEAGPQHSIAVSLFASAGAEGVMQALMAVTQENASPANDGTGTAQSAIGAALADFTGANLIDTIVDHFTAGDTPAIALAANDMGSALLAQSLGGDAAMAVFHDAMSATPDADALALATPHA